MSRGGAEETKRDGDRSLPAGERGYPRPQLVRASWLSLDGLWDFALDPDARWRLPDQVTWRGEIRYDNMDQVVAQALTLFDKIQGVKREKVARVP